jgi:C4-dicarboxylate-specific signal transduction histidine kinase
MVRKGEVRRERVDLNAAVRAAVDLMRSELDAQGVRLVLSLADGLPLVLASQVDIQQVVMNLVMNAARAVKGLPEDDRTVSIRTLRVDRHIRFSVEDSGTGVQKDIVENMFEPFFTTKSVGIGMGLAICRRLVDAHGGRIWVDNRDKGGARFTVELPLTEALQTSDD